MLIDSDFELNLLLGFDDSLQKVLTKTMIHQEAIFRNQVLELHRLYQIQKMLMKELDLKANARESPHSFPFSGHLKDESLAIEMKLSEVHKIYSSASMKNHSLKEHRGKLKHQRMPLDLELSASRYTNDSGELLCESYCCITPEVSTTMKQDSCDDKMSSIEGVRLSLRADAGTWQKDSGKKTCMDTIICSPLRETISLEGSTCAGDLIVIPDPGYATHSGYDFESSCSFRSRKNGAFDWTSKSHSLTDGRPNIIEGKQFDQGVEQYPEEVSCKNISVRRKLFISPEDGQLDLNKALPDESSAHSIDHSVSSPSKCTLLGVSHNEFGECGKGTILTVLDRRKPKNSCSIEPSVNDEQDKMDLTLTISPSKVPGKHVYGSMLCSPDLGSVCEPLSDKNLRPKNVETEISLPDKSCQKISMPEVDAKKDKEDKLYPHLSSQELLEVTDSNRSPVSCKSEGIPDNVSSNSKTEQSGIHVSNSNVSPSTFRNSESSLSPKKIVQQNLDQSVERKLHSSDQKKEELAAVDTMVRKGAVSLMYFSLECIARNRDYISKTKEIKESSNVQREEPQSSSESYEAIVLKQPECSVDEYCMPSTPAEVTGSEQKDSGIKLKRGRRMKDFRKEILPGLASLSRQEICEDIKIMELAIRSREYKKYRSKTATTSDCFSSVRSRRSRLSYVGRRNHL